MRKLSKSAISIIVIATFLISMIPIMPVSAAVTTWYVDDSGTNDPAWGNATHPFDTITYAIGQASAGDTIMVGDGTYNEIVDVDKSLTLIGNVITPASVDVLTTNPDVSVFTLSVDDVSISGFSPAGATNTPIGYHPAGIYIDADVSGCIVSDNDFGVNYDGIYLDKGSHDNIITDNDISNQNNHGIQMSLSSENLFKDNILDSNGENGVRAESSQYNIFIGNSMSSNTLKGVFFTVGPDTYDADYTGNNYNTFMDNTLSLNLQNGIKIFGGTGNTFIRNTITVGAGLSAVRFLDQQKPGDFYTSHTADLSMYNNTITVGAGGIGIEIAATVYDVTSWKINHNNFVVAGTETAIDNLNVNAGTVDAENNWWDVATGPDTTAAATSGNVDADPWLGALVTTALEEAFEGDVFPYSDSGVASGSTVRVFWDTATGAGAQLLNTTTGNPDGSYDFDIEVPSDVEGYHYIWVNDGVNDPFIEATLYMGQIVTLDPDSGLEGDDVTVEGYGFSPESEVIIAFQGDVLTDTAETDEYGYVSYEFDVPASVFGDYIVTVRDSEGFAAYTDYTIGASITLDVEEGPEGTVIEISGRGFDPSVELSLGNVTWDGTYSMPIVDDTANTDSNGEFTLEVVAPSWGEGSWMIEVTDVTNQASEYFTIDGVSKIEVSPTYGSPGASITVKGYNFTQIVDTTVLLNLNDAETTSIGTVDTEADGTFETTFVSPAITFDTYDVWANDTTYGVNASDVFKVGIIAFIINPTYGESGTEVGVTGIGFKADSTYNLTFGDILYEEYGDGVTAGEAISDPFYVPNVEPGTYDLTVIDEDENELTVQFRVTESTFVSMDPALAPNEYNVTIEGYNFADVDDVVDFVIYNSTDSWAMSVVYEGSPVETDSDGNFTGYWEVLDEVTLSLGDYTVNITGTEGLLVQVPFSVVAARVDVAPRKALFDRGDSIQFNINNDFRLPDSYIEIYSPGDVLYWSTELFETDWWMQVEDLYTVPYYRQTAAGNPMELQSDAPMGTWLYIFYDGSDDQLMNGTFEVGASTTAQVDERLQAVEGSLASLADDIAGVTTELSDDLGDLASDLADIASEVDDLRTDIVSDLADDIAAAADAADAAADAVADLEDSVGDIADVATDAKSAAESAASAADDAASAAEEAKTAATGLTTLVYGAIGASLIAALAAIVSLMQISRKIA